MANGEAVSRPKQNEYTVITLSDVDAGEVMTLQRAAHVTEAQAHHDFDLPPLTQSLQDAHLEPPRTARGAE